MRTSLPVLLVTSLLCVPSAAVAAQNADQARPGQGTPTTVPQTAKPKPAPKAPIGLRVFANFDATKMAASSTFTALKGSSTMSAFGAGGEVLNVFRKVFVRVGLQTTSVDGFRGISTPDGFVSTGVPIEVSLKNFEVLAGWRSSLKKHPKGAWYAGGGLVTGSLSQSSPDPDPGDNTDASSAGFGLLAGFEWALAGKKNPIVAGIEGEYKTIGGVLGEGGLSGAYNETDLGGFTIRALIGIRFVK